MNGEDLPVMTMRKLEEAELILGGDSHDQCTYREGYVPRQAVYSCLTCVPEGNAGVCTACALACHDGHELIELLTKREFRCDCGNSKFARKCSLWNEKDPENTRNVYDQNYRGIFCSCQWRYSENELGEMIQCSICEDWFHESHVGLSENDAEDSVDVTDNLSSSEKDADEDIEEELDEPDDDMICPTCIERCGDLFLYWGKSEEEDSIREEAGNELIEQAPAEGAQASEEQAPRAARKQTAADEASSSEPSKTLFCKLRMLKASAGNGTSNGVSQVKRAILVDSKWRSELCDCEDCCRLYESKKLSFLLDSKDTLQHYKTLAKHKLKARQQDAEKAANAEEAKVLQGMSHVAKMELLYAVQDTEAELNSFLRPIAESGKVLTLADALEFSESLKRKRRRMS